MTSTIRASVSSPAAEITTAALGSFDGCSDARLHAIMRSLVLHLHAFVSDVRLTEAEWAEAIRILTATGDITDEKRQEFILWSDALGVSMLVDALAHPNASSGATESTVLGPFWTPGAPKRGFGESLIAGSEAAGTPAYVHGRVLNTAGEPIAGS